MVYLHLRPSMLKAPQGLHVSRQHPHRYMDTWRLALGPWLCGAGALYAFPFYPHMQPLLRSLAEWQSSMVVPNVAGKKGIAVCLSVREY